MSTSHQNAHPDSQPNMPAARELDLPELVLPIAFMRENDLYFYQETVEEFLPGNRVKVQNYGEMLLLGGCSYLGLEGHPALRAAAIAALDRFGAGIQGARLLAGTLAVHHPLEAKIAAFQGTEAAITFTSGYAANTSAIPALVGRHDTVIADKLAHASLIDGCVLSRAKLQRFRHNDAAHLEELLAQAGGRHRTLVVVDGVYSMDGDIADLPAISRACRRHGAMLMVDEAHSFGMLGATGHGIEEHFGLPPGTIDIKMGTLSKAIPASGAYIAGSRQLIDFLVHQARGFVYSGALSPIQAAVALAALEVLEKEPERVQMLQQNAAHFAGRLREAGFDFSESPSAIFPILCGDDEKALRLARGCQRRGIFVQAVVSPVVPQGGARLRAVITAGHRQEDLDWSVEVMAEVAEELGGILPAREAA
jgi:8-amino-7-oxononanoate synthase